MQRPAGVIVSIVLLALGGLLCTAMASLMLFALAYSLPMDTAAGPASPAVMRFAILFVAIIFGATASWQFVTAFGLWRMKPWGRLSLLSFSGVMATFQAMGLLFLFLMPLPPEVGAPEGAAEVTTIVRVILIPFYVVPIAIGIWWLVYFNRATVRAYFSGGSVMATGAQRPVSVITIGWFFVTTAVLWPLAIYWEWPAVFLWMVLTGWSAMVVNTLWCIVLIYAGVGLLRWDLNGYRASVGLLWFGAFNALVFWLIPGSEARMRQMMDATRIPGTEALTNWGGPPPPPSPWLSVVILLLTAGIPLWFLHTNKTEFVAREKGSSDAHSDLR